MKRTAKAGILTLLLAAALFSGCSGAQDTNGTAETTSAVTEMKPTNEKYIPELGFGFVEGIKLGMSVSEVRAVLGEPAKEEKHGDMTVLTYGKNEFTFGTFPDKKGKFSGEALEDGRKNGLMTVHLTDDTMKCYGGLNIGMMRVEFMDGFCHDNRDQTPADLAQNGIKMLYGTEDFTALNEAGDSADGEYVFAYDYIGTEADSASFVYADYDFKNTGLVYMMICSYDDEECRVNDILITMIEA